MTPTGDSSRSSSGKAVRASAAPFYGEDGRPSVDPVVLVKLFLVEGSLAC